MKLTVSVTAEDIAADYGFAYEITNPVSRAIANALLDGCKFLWMDVQSGEIAYELDDVVKKLFLDNETRFATMIWWATGEMTPFEFEIEVEGE